jgi:F-type H+-transporting ATPase subunit delta
MALASPALKNSRGAVLDAVLKKLGVSGEAHKLVRLLADNDRLGVLDEITAEVRAIADERAGRVRAKVTSATKLTEAQQKRLASALEQRFGREVVVEVSVEPTLLGGVVVQVGDLTLDSSLRRQLSLLRERLLA